jgi:hypothetical protein
MSEQAAAYQEQITGLPRGVAVTLNNVTFDGCRESDGVMLEAKALGYVWALRADGTYASYYLGAERLMDQARAQNNAVGTSGRRVEWYFAEHRAADYFRNAFRVAGFTNITVFYQPPVKP